jgi:plasmid stabilization system protein ParE
MQSGYKIFWTREALRNLEGIINYLEKNWTEREIRNFIKKLDKRLDLISLNPKLFPKSDIKRNVRKSVLSKHAVIYYIIEEEFIKIVTLFDPRQHLSKLNL